MSLIIKVTVRQLTELILKNWDLENCGNSGVDLFDRIVADLGVVSCPYRRSQIVELWEKNDILRNKVWSSLSHIHADGLYDKATQTNPDVPFEFTFIEKTIELRRLIFDRRLHKMKMENGLLPCPEYYERCECIVARFGTRKIQSKDAWGVDASLAAVLKGTDIKIIDLCHANAMVLGLISSDQSLLNSNYFIAVYNVKGLIAMLADVQNKKATFLFQKDTKLDTLQLDLCGFIGPEYIGWFIRGLICDKVNESTIIEFISNELNLKVPYDPMSLKALILHNSDSMDSFCLICGEYIKPDNLKKTCNSCYRHIHYSCFNQNEYNPDDCLCDLCLPWTIMLAKP